MNGLQSSLQIFPSSTILETKEFYEQIGFRAVSYLESNQPHICLYKDSIEIVLTKSRLEKIRPNREVHGYGYDAYFISTNQLDFYNEIKNKNITIVKEFNLTDYSNREFIFEDNEGRWIAIGCKEGSKEVLHLQLSHIAFYCDDIDGMEKFYSDLLDLKRVRVFNQGKNDEFFILGRDNFRIELFKKKRMLQSDHASFKHYAIEIQSIDNLITLLHQKHISIDNMIDYSNEDHVFKICFIKDPEGNVIEFMEGYYDQ
ncbi:glyoxalase/bleomycin resistance protein/dioxygenase [Candidatus Moduliflexus flocculans]|uniref:Glyoxalase/bleomycin resistance protein/dioxygenase n=1 Tax=Candidatus Moduliflexus flocculans TaxID=1499966 RepID=A0A0S6VWY0_9BACT|nr:glyoxalase/bleomycin resistance protein/dioxygenase [Candidatus Moduliflexus flocculans]